MQFTPQTITLKDGRTATLRPPREDDAQALLSGLAQECAETDFLLRTPEECAAMTVEGERQWIQGMLASPDTMLIVCDVDGDLAGSCQLDFTTRPKRRHAAVIGIGLRSQYWGLGIGTAMFRMMEDAARKREGVIQLELEFAQGNVRARALYEKMGFRVVSVTPDHLLQPGGLAALYTMHKKL